MLHRLVVMVYFFSIAIVMFILPDIRIHDIALASSVVILLFIYPKKQFQHIRNALEMIILFFILNFIYRKTGLQQIFILTHIITLFTFYLYIFKVKKYQPVIDIFRAGKIKGSILLGILFAVVSITGLILWFINQSQNPHAGYLPDLPLVIMPVLGILFALLNGLFEESIFRGILLPCFSETIGWIPAVIMQALWFSFLHYQAGFPSGIIGIILTFTFAIMMAVLVKRTGGLLLPVLVHAAADFSIFIMILTKSSQII